MDPFLGEIRLFAGNFAPSGWQFCDGTLLSVAEHSSLFALIGSAWGGDGSSTFAVPDLRGRVPVGQGAGEGLSLRTLGQKGGASTVAITQANLPAHSHAFSVSNQAASTATVSADVGLAQPVAPASGKTVRYAAPTAGAGQNVMAPNAITPAPGNSKPHPNLMPYLAINYIICTNGEFPDQA